MELLTCQNLTKTYGNYTALDHVNITLPRNKIIGLLGKNGAGKSTFIKLCNDLLAPTSGQILVNGEPISPSSKRVISYLPERTYLDKSMRVQDALKFFAEFYDNFNLEKAQNLVKDLKLDFRQRISKMSKGMQEKLQLILVMSRKAKLYILDEPLGGIDPATRDYILDTILSNFDNDASLLISTHLISDVERILDEVIFIDNGKIILTGDADKLRTQYNTSIDQIFRNTFKNQSA